MAKKKAKGKRYTQEEKARILAEADASTIEQASLNAGVSKAAISAWRKQRKLAKEATGTINGTVKSPKAASFRDVIRDIIREELPGALRESLK